MKSKYSEAFIEQAVVKLLSREGRTVRAVALDLNVNYHTAKNWIKRGSLDKVGVAPTKEKSPQNWSAQEQLVALHETHLSLLDFSFSRQLRPYKEMLARAGFSGPFPDPRWSFPWRPTG